jgi:proton-dependent oligopeptide transporter, POT family
MRYNVLRRDSLHGNPDEFSQQEKDHDTNRGNLVMSSIDRLHSSIALALHQLSLQLKKSLDSLKSCPKELYVNFGLKFCESYNYFAISQVLVIYLHEEFGLSDMAAGGAYGLWGAAITFWGLSASWLNDNLGVRKSLLVGFTISFFSTMAIAFARSKTFLFIILFVIYPLGTSMGIPMLTVGIRRYTNASNRGFAYGLYYAVMNIAAFVSGPVVDILNVSLTNGVMIAGVHYSGNRLVIMTASFVCLCSIILTYTSLREIRVSDSEVSYPMEVELTSQIEAQHEKYTAEEQTSSSISRESSAGSVETYSPLLHPSTEPTAVAEPEESIENFTPSQASIIEIAKQLLVSKTFWRFTFFSLFLINLNAVFRHLDATLPTYLIREFGSNVPKGIIYSINPMIIIMITPVIAALTSQYAHYDMIKYGGYVTALSPFFLACSTSIWATIAFVTMLSFGEAIWSPRVYDYTMSISPEGREASFAALSAAPLFAAKIPVGLMSGLLLSRYLPEHGKKDGQTMWLIIGLLTLSSPICITMLEKYIREPDHRRHSQPTKAAAEELDTAAGSTTSAELMAGEEEQMDTSASDKHAA